MKCDQIRTRQQGDTPFFPNMLNNGNVEVCLKEDVDAAIAELKSENERLNNALDKERRLKRALWIARAERANDKQTYYTHTRGDGWCHRVSQWIEVERKCLNKAEEYK